MELGTRQQVQRLGRTCHELTYSVKTSVPFLQLHVIVEGSLLLINSQIIPATVNATILPWPLGFTELGYPPVCACLPHLTQANIVCDIQTQTHLCPAGMWIGNFSGGITTHPHCPYDYCKSQRPSVSLTSQHEQCQYSCSGVLCGACRGDLSLCLGMHFSMQEVLQLLHLPSPTLHDGWSCLGVPSSQVQSHSFIWNHQRTNLLCQHHQS